MKSVLTLLALLLLAHGAAAAQQSDRVFLKSPLAQKRHLPFSSGVLVGNTLYIAGTTGVDPTTKQPVSLTEEARLVMDNVKRTVEKAGLTMDDIVSLQVYCTDLKNYGAFNSVYATYFHGDFPARAFIGTSSLLFGARFEVMGIAVRRTK
jgi:2-iminobutanoate/2-iminopropanoate deaminase